jgi:hypothetical protein
MNIRVRQGGNMWFYSQLFQIPFTLLLDSNQDINPSALQIGQIVRIPGFTIQTHTIQSGELPLGAIWCSTKEDWPLICPFCRSTRYTTPTALTGWASDQTSPNG